MPVALYVVDAFTRRAFAGNSAAVVLVEHWPTAALMQSIAFENNLSETAFALSLGDNRYAIRWFSPITEVDFCGHATLACARILFDLNPALSEILFSAAAIGEISVTQNTDGLIEMAFPIRAPKPIEPPQALLEGLSIQGTHYGFSEQAYFVFMQNEEAVRAVVPDCDKLKTLAPYDVVVTAQGADYDFVSRYFWPANGGAEDPVTGSIHAGLAPYWASTLGKTTLHAYQASARGGELFCRVTDDKVYVAGYSVRYLTGTINL